MKYLIQPLISSPGFQRDGTPYDSKSYIAGQWCRFYKGRPRKMNGYRLMDAGQSNSTYNEQPISGIVNSMFSVAKPGNLVDLYLGRANSLSVFTINNQGFGDAEITRTPSTLTIDPNNKWSMDLFTTQVEGVVESYITAHCAPNNLGIANTINGTVFYGSSTNLNVLQPVTDVNEQNPSHVVQVSGGIVFVSPFLLACGNDGVVYWSNEGDVTTWDTSKNFLVVGNTKIVKGMPARSGTNITRGGSSPAVLLWSLNSLIRLTYTIVNDVETFGYETIQSDISILAPNSVVQYNQMFFWIGANQFFYFNGIVNKLDNTMCSDYFFNNLNYDQAAKIFGIVNPRYDEIWWFYPKGDSLECNAAVIFNVKDQIWYDTDINRASGIIPDTFSRPVLADSATVSTPTPISITQTYPIWLHETGLDKVINRKNYAIESWFQTHLIDLFSNDPQNTNMIYTRRIQPDFIQNGQMDVIVSTQNYPAETPVQQGPFPFQNNTPFVDNINAQGSIVNFIFRSNVQGGYYQMGKTLMNYTIGNEIK